MTHSASLASGAATMDALLRGYARTQGAALALTVEHAGGSTSLTYAELDGAARALALVLRARMPKAGRALLMLENDQHYVIAFFACLYAGMVAVPAFPPDAARGQELNRLRLIARDCQAGCVLTTSAAMAVLGDAAALFDGVPFLAVDALQAHGEAPAWVCPASDPRDIAFLQYTSGSTADPKGVMVSHANLMANALAMRLGMGTRETDVCVSWLPLYHDMGLIGGLLQGLYLGTRVVLMSPRYFLERPLRWLEAMSRHGGNFSGGPDFAYRLCVERIRSEQLRGLDLSGWRIAFSGAEPVRAETLEGFARLCADARLPATALYPCYGLAEATLFVAGGDHARAPICTVFDEAALAQGQARRASQGRRLVACGAPAPGHRIAIVDPETSHLLPEGHQGEIRVAGPSIARGYWENAAATQRSLLTRAGDCWLRTGDLGFMYGGQLYINGRIKDLIIVRGRNLYPHDIEAVVEAEVPQARKGRVAAFAVETPEGEGIGLAVEIAPLQRKRHAPAALVRALNRAVALACGEALSVTVLLEPGALPKTSSGKLQRAATHMAWRQTGLRAYAIHEFGRFVVGEEGEAATVPPRGETEEALAAIWSEVLGRRVEDRGARFFELGGSSLSAAQVAACMRRRWRAELGVRDVFAHTELARCAAHIDARVAARAEHEAAQAGIPRAAPQVYTGTGTGTDTDVDANANAARAGALAPVQRRLWLLDRMAQDAEARARYNVGVAFRLEGELDTARVERAINAIVARHAVLRTAYPDDEEGDPVACVAPSRHIDIAVADMAHEADAEAAAMRLAVDHAYQPFDLARGPLLRTRLVRVRPALHLLVLAVHHIVFDGWSVGVFIDEFCAHYAGREPAALPLQYADYAAASALAEREGTRSTALAYWRTALAGAPAVSSLASGRGGARHGSTGAAPVTLGAATLMQSIPGSLARRLSDLAGRHDATLFQVLLTAFLMMMHRHTEQDDLVVGTDTAGRDHPDLAPLIGFFVNVLPLRSRVLAAAGFAEWLARVRAVVLESLEHQSVPFDRIVEVVNASRDRARNPLVQVLFVMQNTLRLSFDLPGLSARALPLPPSHARFDLAVFVHEHDQGLEIEWTYATALHDPAAMARMATIWGDVLRRVAEDDGRPWHLADIPLPTEATMPATPPAPIARPTRAKLDGLSMRRTGSTAGPHASGPVRIAPLSPERPFPLVMEATDPDLDPLAWADAQREQIEALLRRHAGILFRNFGLRTPQQFEGFAEAVEPMLYGGYGDLPKKEGGRNTYRSTPYPEKQMILYHNESAHLERWPRKQLFFCELPSKVGGATPIVDCREMLRRLPAELVAEFERKQLLYVRTFTERLDVSWQQFFKTDNRQAVEARLRQAGTAFRWLDDATLQTRSRCPAVIAHPQTGERVFFNQVQLHHIHCLDPEVRGDLLDIAGVERMPRQVYFGDGSPISEAVMDLIGRTYEECAVRFPWKQGDVVMLDNMLAAHARDPYEEPRKVVVAMGAMFDRAALARGTA